MQYPAFPLTAQDWAPTEGNLQRALANWAARSWPPMVAHQRQGQCL